MTELRRLGCGLFLERKLLTSVTLLVFASAWLLGGRQTHAQNTYRNLSGTVSDQHHEPLAGAIVEVQNAGDNTVTSYITDKAGHYEFRRLNSGADYNFWATYRSHRSRSEYLSKFNSKTAPVVNLEIKLE